MTNITEFYAAGIGFSIVSADADFTDDGELSGYHVIINEDYSAFDGNGESEGLTDTNELRDDTQRWEHLRDTHLSERLTELHTLAQSDKLWDEHGRTLPVYGELSYHALDRERRYRRLLRYATKLARHRHTAVRQRIWAHYRTSVQLAARRGEWYLISLTRVQVDAVLARLR